MDNKRDSLRGEGRKIVSTRIYRSEFANFFKICEVEKGQDGRAKSVNQKLRELIQQEIEGKKLSNKDPLIKMKEDKESAEEKNMALREQWNFKIVGENENV